MDLGPRRRDNGPINTLSDEQIHQLAANLDSLLLALTAEALIFLLLVDHRHRDSPGHGAPRNRQVIVSFIEYRRRNKTRAQALCKPLL
jgi:hypothetical protein